MKERYVMYHHTYVQVEAMRKEAALSVIQVDPDEIIISKCFICLSVEENG